MWHQGALYHAARTSVRKYEGHGYRRREQRVQSSFLDGVKKFFDDIAFENWAPRSSRAWRLNLPPREASEQTNSSDEKERAQLWESLEEEITRSYSEEKAQSLDAREGDGDDIDEETEASFVQSSDSELSDALNTRISEIAEGDGNQLPQRPLSGMELRNLIFSKYNRTYDVAFARRDLWGKPLVSLNIMWNHLEQSSFPLSESQLMEKYDRFAIYLNSWEQANKVREFLTAPRKAKSGLPSRPIMGIAVSFQLDLPPHIVSEWFDKN